MGSLKRFVRVTTLAMTLVHVSGVLMRDVSGGLNVYIFNPGRRSTTAAAVAATPQTLAKVNIGLMGSHGY